jgi:virulence-associated protein VagC
MSETRTIRLQRLDGDQVVDIPLGWEFPDGEALVSKDGDRLIIAPKSVHPDRLDHGSIDPRPRRP